MLTMSVCRVLRRCMTGQCVCGGVWCADDVCVPCPQAVYDRLPPPPPEPAPADIQEVKRLASHIQAKLHRYVGALWRTRGVIEEMFWKHLHDPMTTVTPCCSLDDRQLK